MTRLSDLDIDGTISIVKIVDEVIKMRAKEAYKQADKIYRKNVLKVNNSSSLDTPAYSMISKGNGVYHIIVPGTVKSTEVGHFFIPGIEVEHDDRVVANVWSIYNDSPPYLKKHNIDNTGEFHEYPLEAIAINDKNRVVSNNTESYKKVKKMLKDAYKSVI